MIRPPIFALVDCDNFFVSCERAFRPDLWGKPVAVLSNNDGCVVARSNEVKALGVPMGIPYFKVKDVFNQHKITIFSGNFSLYGDFSQRVVRVLEQVAPRVEVYSVDESFLEISTLDIADYDAWARQLHQKVWQELGIPVSVGVAPSKTLAKAAAEKAKHEPALRGGYSVVGAESRRELLLRETSVQDVWGVGWRTAPKLQNRGIKTAFDLSHVSDAWARQQLTIRGLNTVRELRGTSCSELEDAPKPQQSLAVTRTFAHRVRAWHELEGMVASFAARAAQKLRKYHQLTGEMRVFIAGDRHRDGDNYRRVGTAVPLLQPSNDTSVLISAALQALATLYDGDFSYRRAGINCVELVADDAQQLSWLSGDTPSRLEKRATLMQRIDTINHKYHTNLVRHAVEPRAGDLRYGTHRSPAYTTRWQELPVVKTT